MVALSRCIGPVAMLAASVQAARVSKRRATAEEKTFRNTKFIAGVPVLNYNQAYGGQSALTGLEESLEEEWVVMMKPGSTDAQIDSLCKSAKKGCEMSGHPDKGGVPFFDMRGTERDLEAVIKSSNGAVQMVEPNQVMHMTPELDPQPANSASWGLGRVGASGRNGNLGAGVSIYILDTGVRTTHNDFGDRASPAIDYSGSRPITCNGDLECAADRQGHGTHCAGTAAGTTFGVAPQANVYGVKVLGDNGAGSMASIVGSVDWLATTDTRPAVGSMSLGGQCPFGWCFLMSSMKTAVESAVASGVTVVVAGGNSNSDACGFSPAFVPAAITVGSTDSQDARSYFSNYGSCTDIWAPGSDITSASHEDDTGAKTFSGTSMACPHVAGGAALVLEQNPGFSPDQVIDQLLADAATNYITDLKPEDTNKLLYVASDAPPPKGSVPTSLVEAGSGRAPLTEGTYKVEGDVYYNGTYQCHANFQFEVTTAQLDRFPVYMDVDASGSTLDGEPLAWGTDFSGMRHGNRWALGRSGNYTEGWYVNVPFGNSKCNFCYIIIEGGRYDLGSKVYLNWCPSNAFWKNYFAELDGAIVSV